VTATRYAAEAYASFLSQRWFVVWLYSIEVWSAGGCKTETDLPWRRWCVVESCSGVRELRPLAFCTRQTMKLFKGNLTSRLAHSARLHKERLSLKVKGITTSVVRMCSRLVPPAWLSIGIFIPARAVLAYNQLSGFRKSWWSVVRWTTAKSQSSLAGARCSV